MPETKSPETKLPSTDPKERLLQFSADLFQKLNKDQTAKLELSKAWLKQAVLTLHDNEEIAIVQEVSNDAQYAEQDPNILSLVIRKPNSKTGAIEEYSYGINSDAFKNKLSGREVEEADLQLQINGAARAELQPVTAADAVRKLGRSAAAIYGYEKHSSPVVDSLAEVILSNMLDELARHSLEEWHDNWTLELSKAA